VALKEDLQEAVAKIFKGQWTQRDGEVVPEPEDLGLGNDAVNLDGTVLYADMADSTKLVDSQKAHLAAEGTPYRTGEKTPGRVSCHWIFLHRRQVCGHSGNVGFAILMCGAA
jgi:hypothetical protein